MQKASLILMFLMLTSSSLAAVEAPAIRLESARGQIQFNGKSVQSGAPLSGHGNLTTGSDGFAQVRFLPSGTLLSVTPSSKIELEPEIVGKSQELVLAQGMVRWKIGRKAGPGTATQWKIRGHSATMGVRGTEFLAVSNALLAETEIIVFEGQVEFTSQIDPKDSRKIEAGYWGGVGGRFGQKIGDPIHLPANVIESFDHASKP